MRSLGSKHIGKTIKITRLSDNDAFTKHALSHPEYTPPVLNIPVVVKELVFSAGRSGGVLVYNPSEPADIRINWCILNYLEFEIVN
jgi:hypothetical protein